MTISIGILGTPLESDFVNNEYLCQCDLRNDSVGDFDPECYECHGTGIVIIPQNKFESSWCLSSLFSVSEAIGMKFSEYGSIDPVELFCMIDDSSDYLYRAIIDCDHHIIQLADIALEAEKRGSSVVWG